VTPTCPQCREDVLHHSRPRSWVERLRRRLTGRVPFRCYGCGWRGWLPEPGPAAQGPREIHKYLTDAELERFEPDDNQGEGA
jgi:hypothetical protein